MIAAFGLLSSYVTIEALCTIYFLLAPIFMDGDNRLAANSLFAIGYMITALLASLFFAERLISVSHRLRWKTYSLSIIGLVTLCFLTIAWNTPGSLLDPGAYYVKYMKVLGPFFCFFVMVNVWSIDDIPRLYRIMILMTWASALFLVPEAFMLAQNESQAIRFGSLFKEPNKFALFLSIVYGITLALLIRNYSTHRPISKLFFGVGSLTFLTLLTQSRGGVVTWTILTAICFAPQPARPLFKKALLLLVPIGIIFAFSVVVRYVTHNSNAVDSDLGRLWTYFIAINIIQDRPLAGIGYGNVLQFYGEYGEIYRFLIGKPLGIHNAALEIFAEEGLFGFVFYCLMMGTPIIVLLKRLRQRSIKSRYPVFEVIGLTVPVGFMLYGLFYPSYLSDDYFWTLMVLPILILRHPNSGELEFEYVGSLSLFVNRDYSQGRAKDNAGNRSE